MKVECGPTILSSLPFVLISDNPIFNTSRKREGREGGGAMSTAAAVSPVTTAEIELKTYWCHECDMSVALTSPSTTSSSPSTLVCPHCHSHQFLELMDSIQADPNPFPTTLSLFDTSYLLRLFQQHLIATTDDAVIEDDDEDLPPDNAASVPTIVVTDSLLSELDSGGAVLCAVCKDPIFARAEAKQLPCKHLYHCNCIVPWLAHHNSCPLCRFQLGTLEQEEGVLRARRTRRQLRMAMMCLSELMDEEEEDFYGLRTTLSHIAHRHGLLNFDTTLSQNEAETISVGGNGDMGTVERGVIGLPLGGDA